MVISVPLQTGSVLVKKGQSIEIGDPLFEQKSQKETKIFISQILKVPSHTIFKHLKKCVGDEVKKGDLVAEHGSLFSKARYKSEFDGIIKEINHTDGSIAISITMDEDFVVRSYLKGEVVEINKKELQIKITKPKTYETKEIRGTAGGKAVYIRDEHQVITEEMIAGSIIVTEKLTPYTQMKMEALGSSGFVLQRQLSEETVLAHAVLKTIADFEEIQKTPSSYCFIDEKQGTIVFYH